VRHCSGKKRLEHEQHQKCPSKNGREVQHEAEGKSLAAGARAAGGYGTDDARIVAALPTIQYLLKYHARVILMSHLGQPKGVTPSLSLSLVATRLAELLRKPVALATDCIGPEVMVQVGAMLPGSVVLLENVRFHPEETQNDPVFAAKLAKLGDVFIQDAFAVFFHHF
jgi:phosphoglycerate kinase